MIKKLFLLIVFLGNFQLTYARAGGAGGDKKEVIESSSTKFTETKKEEKEEEVEDEEEVLIEQSSSKSKKVFDMNAVLFVLAIVVILFVLKILNDKYSKKRDKNFVSLKDVKKVDVDFNREDIPPPFD